MELTKLKSAIPLQELWVDLSDIIKVDRKNLPPQSVIIQNDDIEFTKLTFTNGQTTVCLDDPAELIPMINAAKAAKAA